MAGNKIMQDNMLYIVSWPQAKAAAGSKSRKQKQQVLARSKRVKYWQQVLAAGSRKQKPEAKAKATNSRY
jgi:hypothetical protein